MKRCFFGLAGVALITLAIAMIIIGTSYAFPLVVGLLYYVGVILAIGLGLIILAIVLQG